MIGDEAGRAAAAERDARDLRWSRMMAAAQAGDARAYGDLLRECLPLLRAICRARLRDETEAEDAVVAALGGLSAAALVSVGLTLIHHLDAAMMVLVWHGMSVLVVAAITSLLGPRLMRRGLAVPP